MTTLSKEDVVRMASKYYKQAFDWYAFDDCELHAFIAEARADLVAENERISKLCVVEAQEWARSVGELRDQLTATRTALEDMEKQRDYWINDRKALQFADDAKIEELSTVLAAAEARETKLRAAIDVVLSDAEECEDHDGWLANLVSCEAIHQLDEAFIQTPRRLRTARDDRRGL